MHKLIAIALLGLSCTPLWAADCAATIEGNDAMQFNLKTIEVPASCKNFSVTLKHAGTLAKNVMGHNWVLAGAGDEAAINADGLKAGLDSDYLKPGDARVIAHTRIIGGGETDTAKFAVGKLKAGEAYAFFCSYPGHAALMKGTLTVAK